MYSAIRKILHPLTFIDIDSTLTVSFSSGNSNVNVKSYLNIAFNSRNEERFNLTVQMKSTNDKLCELVFSNDAIIAAVKSGLLLLVQIFTRFAYRLAFITDEITLLMKVIKWKYFVAESLLYSTLLFFSQYML